ncbi:MAG: hypothetical protein A2992_07625 [Elusimicrobia bacterium RIFCSPLOWO2_01_FULL_59_12]|nr:MAG: hypothetical protein A2992_07625 [Elusimicrobia bacterium RIFCSPLOWO2_01_FULL_59_12]
MNLALRDIASEPPRMRNTYGLALGAHVILFIWNPVVLPGSAMNPAQILMQIEYRDKPPEPPKPPVVQKKVEKKPVVKKVKKSGILFTRPPRVTRAPAPRPRVSAIKIPKFVPRASDDTALLTAAPTPTAKTPALRPAANPFSPMPKLTSRSRGIRASDIPFQLKDRGGMSGGGAVVAIPIGDERSQTASIAAAPALHNAPKGRRLISNSSYQAPLGDGVGELAGKNRSGYVASIQVGGPSDQEIVAAGSSHGDVRGQGFEVGGPVGDRKILRRHLPEYPTWAEEKGISAIVKIFFTVKSDGSIRQSLRVVRSSGYTELDSLAKEAILAWRFSPTRASSTTEESWGVVTFRFTLA